jgi:nucleoside-diphosphate-sugar epimerase
MSIARWVIMSKTILVVGGAGYLGSVLCRKLLEKGYNVRVLDCLLYGDKGIEELYSNEKFEFILGDMRDIQVLMRCVKNVGAVIHLAAIVGDPASSLEPAETLEINYLSAKSLARICRFYKINKFIFASTSSVYGASNHLLTEMSSTNPLSLYAEMKLKSENGLMKMKRDGFSPCILRMGTLYGLSPRMRFDLVVNWFVINAIKKKELIVCGGQQERCFCHLNDAADAYIGCLEAPVENICGKIFNVSSQNLKIIELAKLISEKIPNTKITTEEKNVDGRSYATSSERIKKAIGWEPNFSIADFTSQIKDTEKWDDYLSPIYNNYNFLKNGL